MTRISLLFLGAAGTSLLTYAISFEPSTSATAQERTRQANQANRNQRQQQAEEFPQRLWRFLQESRYRNWAPWPGQDGDFYEGVEPHGALLKIYINRTAASNPQKPPSGSIIIKENYTPDRELAAITIMQRVEGFNPDHGDWYWIKYDPDGSVSVENGMRVAGKVQGCIRCHSTAEDDYLFLKAELNNNNNNGNNRN